VAGRRPVAPRYEVTSLDDASWINEESGATALVTLSRGSAAFHVHHLEAGQRFLVALPDGEIEVRGTRFVVDVEGGSTRYVVVIEGRVAFRAAGQAERILIGGQRWNAPLSPTATPKSTAALNRKTPALLVTPKIAAARISRSAHAQTSAVSRGEPAGPPAPVSAPVASPRVLEEPPSKGPGLSATDRMSQGERAAREPPPPTPSSTLFAQAIEALRGARYGDADTLLRQFLAKHPSDPRAEDAAFLLVVGRARSGDRRGVAELARAYLERFPQGMRRLEAERLSRQAP
jgi:TolA-binding protein